MRPLVAVRRAVAFDPTFAERDPLFAPLARPIAALSPLHDFPDVTSLGRVFACDPPVTFVEATPRRRRGEPVQAAALYDARITIDAEVPTRPRCWHDLMNALVWGAFPRAKQALHARQHRAIVARMMPGQAKLPPTRSPELDALALLDEGGVVIVCDEPDAVRASLRADHAALRSAVEARTATAWVFGHAIYESLALGVRPAIVAAVVLPRAGEPTNADARDTDCADADARDTNCADADARDTDCADADARDTDCADAALASWIDRASAALSPRDLARVDLSDLRRR